MAEHNRLVLNSNPYLYPAQLMQYAQAYCQKDRNQPQAMQRAKSVPAPDFEGRAWGSDGRRRLSETYPQGQRSRSPYKYKGPQRIPSYMPQFSASESELSRPYYSSFNSNNLASALGLRQIEMIPQDQSSEGKINRENLLSHDSAFDNGTQPIMTFSDAGDSQSSIGMTLASSRSSPNSMKGCPSPLMPTYAQMSAGSTTDAATRLPPPLCLNHTAADPRTVSSHFGVPCATTNTASRPRAVSGKTFQHQMETAGPVSYAAKASVTPTRALSAKNKSIPS